MRGVAIAVLLGLPLVLSTCDWEDDTNPVVKFQNETDEPLCFWHANPCAPIKPRDDSKWAIDSCFEEGEVRVLTPEGRQIYLRRASCGEWDDARVVINERDGEFIVEDNLDSP
jgi:hypothetical protein